MFGFDFLSDAWDVVQGVGEFLGGERRNAASASSAREQMAFQERMSNTAHQREVTDLRAAGLNPILSSKLGGASSPAGALATVENTIGPAVSSARASARLREELRQVRANTAVAEQTETKTRAEQVKIATDTVKSYWEAERAKVDATSAVSQERILRREAEDVEKFGSSQLGRSVGSLKRMITELLSELGLTGRSSAKEAPRMERERGRQIPGGYELFLDR